MQKHRASRISSADQSSDDLKKLRRLSSITSITSFGSPHSTFTSWIPFTRRRQTTDVVNAASEPAIRGGGSNDEPLLTQQSQAEGSREMPTKPIPGNSNAKINHVGKPLKSSLPRSSTFSHLPISTGNRQPSETRPLLVSSPNPSTLPPSRIPTPATAERSCVQDRSKAPPMTPKHNAFGRSPRTSSLVRATTHPVLPTIEATPPSTEKTKKENSLSYTTNAQHAILHQSPAAARGSTKPMATSYTWSKVEQGGHASGDDRRRSRKAAANPTPRRATNLQKTDEHAGIYYLTPVNQHMQRGRSQPILGSAGQTKHQPKTAIRGTSLRQLIQPLRPPTPSIPQTPIQHNQIANKKIRNVRSSGASRYTSTPCESPCSGRESPATTQLKLLQVSLAQPTAYWAGRLVALSDRLQSEHASHSFLSRHSSSRPLLSNPQSRGSSNTTTTTSSSTINLCANPLDIELESETDRTRNALTILFAYCTTEAAADSLHEFQLAYAGNLRLPEVAVAIPTPRIEKVALQVGTVTEELDWVRNSAGANVGSARRKKGFWAGQRQREEGSSGMSSEEPLKSPAGVAGGGSGSGRKFSFVEKLMGKTRRMVS